MAASTAELREHLSLLLPSGMNICHYKPCRVAL